MNAPLAACLLMLIALPCLLAEEVLDSGPQAVATSFAEHDYAKAETLLRHRLTATPTDADLLYNLACAVARQGRGAEALQALEQAAANGFSDADHTLADEDLLTLRAEPRFQAAIAVMRSRPFAAGLPIEPLLEVPGARVVERMPGDGMRYRLYISAKASAQQPARLLIWLHPSGASVDEIVLQRLAADILAHGWALMIFPQKQYRGWQAAEMARLQPSITDLRASEPALDAARPVALAFSAGGQVALELWFRDPAYWSGMVLDAAYPVDVETHQLRPLGDAQIASKTPILVLIGSKDTAAPLWGRAAPEWNRLGVPVEVVTVEGHGHEFLFSGEAWTSTLKWLDARRSVQAVKPAAGAVDPP